VPAPLAQNASGSHPGLTERQHMVLRAAVAAYMADATPASSAAVSHLLPVALSSASIRSTMAELAGLGLLEKPHASAGRVPTEAGIRLFVDALLERTRLDDSLNDYDRRALAGSLDEVDREGVMPRIARLLSEHTHQLGFALKPRLERLTLRHVSLVRVAENRLLAVLVPKTGPIQQRVVEHEGRGDQAELDRMAADLNARVVGLTLSELRAALERELHALRSEARGWLFRSLVLGLRVFADDPPIADAELVITARSALLSQPEFNDPDRIRGLMGAVETQERLLEVLNQLLESDVHSVSISLGGQLEDPGLRNCALVAIPYGRGCDTDPDADEYPDTPGGRALGVLGVIGPSRMDYARVIPLVSYCSRLVTRKLGD
jgi:heat-inducible transcriptional repressor